MAKNKKITVKGTEITVIHNESSDYISLTDMANSKDGDSRAADIIKNWLRNRYTLEFIGTWEQINNKDFKVVEFDHFKMQAGLPSFVLSVIDNKYIVNFFLKKGNPPLHLAKKRFIKTRKIKISVECLF